MINLLDSFNPEKAKCVVCKKYFDKSDLEEYFRYFFCGKCETALEYDYGPRISPEQYLILCRLITRTNFQDVID